MQANIIRRVIQSSELSVILARVTAVLLGPLVALAITHNLDPVLQGFYFSFTSIVAAQSLFEAGLSVVIIQMIAHEKAVGSSTKIASILTFFKRWFRMAAILMGFLIGTAGAISFARAAKLNTAVDWALPWLLVVGITAVEFTCLPYFFFFEGIGLVKSVYKFRTVKSLLYSTTLIASFSLNADLYSIAIASLISLSSNFAFLFINRKVLPKSTAPINNQEINWKRDILPFQWRVACAWMAGYFTVSVFTPTLLWLHGPVEAGKMGLSVSVLGSCTVIAASVMQANAAKLGTLFAGSEIVQFIALFNKRARLSVVLAMAAIISLVSFVFILKKMEWAIADRFVGLHVLVILAGGYFLYHIEGVLAYFSRAQKIEPYLKLEIVSGILIFSSTVWLGQKFGAAGVAAGFLGVRLFISTPLAALIYVKSKKNLCSIASRNR